MISHTCLIAPTGVPVDVMTHCACELDPPAGICSEAPAGHVVDLTAPADVVPTKAVVRLTPVRAIIAANAAATSEAVRNRRRLIPEIRTDALLLTRRSILRLPH